MALGGGWLLSTALKGRAAWAVKADMPYYRQRRTLSCEMASLRMATAYFGLDLSEEALIRWLAFDSTLLRLEADGSLIWGDPNMGFVGSIDGKQMYQEAMTLYPPSSRSPWKWGYGVYPAPIAELAVKLGLYASCLNALEDVYWQLDRGRPVIVILPYAGRTEAPVWTWYTEQGNPVRVIDAQHSVIVHPGYDDKRVYVHDPVLYEEDRVGAYTHEDFAKAFSILSLAVAIGKRRRTTPIRMR